MKNSDRCLSLFLELPWRRQCERLDEAARRRLRRVLESWRHRLTPEGRREVEATFDRLKDAGAAAGTGAHEPVFHPGDDTLPAWREPPGVRFRAPGRNARQVAG